MGTRRMFDIKNKIKSIVTSGASPTTLALSIAIGITCGVFPIPGLTSVPCVVATFFLPVNIAIVLTVNYLCTPLNLATFLLFIRWGETITGTPPASLEELTTALSTNVIGAVQTFAISLAVGAIAWLLFVPFATLALFLPIRLVATLLKPNKSNKD
eukprot:c5727_g1_i2.p1 GENE.c5727_g1_i2~~c5727_g1_i2.p1  ORF type:complete len:156 (+),score=33.05 c5727_g1_i2:1-468(+)